VNSAVHRVVYTQALCCFSAVVPAEVVVHAAVDPLSVTLHSSIYKLLRFALLLCVTAVGVHTYLSLLCLLSETYVKSGHVCVCC